MIGRARRGACSSHKIAVVSLISFVLGSLFLLNKMTLHTIETRNVQYPYKTRNLQSSLDAERETKSPPLPSPVDIQLDDSSWERLGDDSSSSSELLDIAASKINKGSFSSSNTFEYEYKKRFAIKLAFHEHMQRYIQMHKNAGNGNKYIILDVNGQMCNVLRGTISAMLIALLTDRVLVVPRFLSKFGNTAFTDLFEDPGFKFYENRMVIPRDAKTRSVRMEDGELFTCRDFGKELEKYQVIKVAGAYYIGTLIMKNPHYQQRLMSLFSDNDIARPILAYLFQPKHELLNYALKQRAQLIGIPNSDFNKITPATQRKHFLTYHIRSEFGLSDAEAKAYVKCARDVLPNDKVADSAVYVATDSMEFVRKLKFDFSVAKGAVAEPAFYSTDSFVKGGQKGGLVIAFTDLLTASLGDTIFVSAFSSFSRMIMLYAETPNVYLVTDDGLSLPERDPHFKRQDIDSKFCSRFYHKEPASWHGWRKSCSERLKELSCWNPSMQVPYC